MASLDGTKRFKPEKFKMKVTQERVLFGSGGFFNNTEMEIHLFGSPNLFTARDRFSILGFENGVFTYGGLLIGENVQAITARCDDF